MYGFGQCFAVPCTEEPCAEYVRANRQTDKEVYYKRGDRSGGANGGEGMVSTEFSHYHYVCRVEQHLEYTGY